MIINTGLIRDYCRDMEGDCRACDFLNEDGSCKYKKFMESYEYVQHELDDYDYDTEFCYLCGKALKNGDTRHITSAKVSGGRLVQSKVCTKCLNKLKKYERANNLEVAK